MRRSMAAVVFFILVTASTAQAQFFVYGHAFSQEATAYYNASYFQMKWCRADANLQPTSQCGYGSLDQAGNFNISIPDQYAGGYYYPYLLRNETYLGSD